MRNLDTILSGLGLLPAESRTVKPIPTNLKALVSPPVDNNLTIKPGTPDVEADTMPLIIAKSKRTAYQSKKLAEKLQGSTLAATLRNNSNFVLDYIKYKKDDPSHEQVRSPRRLIHDSHGDCDCFAVFLATLLINQGIHFRFRITKYKNSAGEWSHIYIIVPKDQRNKTKAVNSRSEYYVLDPVTNRHDYEVDFIEKKDYDIMSLQFLDGFQPGKLGCCDSTGEVSTVNTNAKNSGNGSSSSGSAVSEAPKKVYIVSEKALSDAGKMKAGKFLAKTGLPFKEKVGADGMFYYEVQTPSGIKKLPGIISLDPKIQQTIISELMQPAPKNNLRGADQNTASEKATLVKALLGIGTVASVLSFLRGSANGLGTLPRKQKLPAVQL